LSLSLSLPLSLSLSLSLSFSLSFSFFLFWFSAFLALSVFSVSFLSGELWPSAQCPLNFACRAFRRVGLSPLELLPFSSLSPSDFGDSSLGESFRPMSSSGAVMEVGQLPVAQPARPRASSKITPRVHVQTSPTPKENLREEDAMDIVRMRRPIPRGDKEKNSNRRSCQAREFLPERQPALYLQIESVVKHCQ